MAFEGKVMCDANDCNHEIYLDSSYAEDAENNYHNLTLAGWLIDFEDGDYCPKCAPIVKAEMEQD